MASVTSQSNCVSGSPLADKIIELGERISTLNKIQDAEKLMDTIIFGPAQTDKTMMCMMPPLPVLALPILWSRSLKIPDYGLGGLA